ncbi:MAG: serine/threonine phosphatase [Synechococcales cyanobacterium M58_A2018_015]|nr:serine/threonine phosphatase [Synechococcales cyanobacterium M58_A2018_015]
MRVCSQCQFENPDSHNFCQRCGVSLVERDCPVCGTTVALDVEFCPQCGVTTGQLWRAILSPRQAVLPSTMQPLAATGPAAPLESAISLPSGKYLDAQQRYRLLEPLPATLTTELEVRVLDCQPLQSSRIATWLQSATDKSNCAVGMSAIARCYWELQEQFPALPLPYLHDAWQQEDFSVVLISDRAALPLLLDVWADAATLPLQKLHWLHEVADLWMALQSYQCCRSVLELSNLRVDADQLLCLQRLYCDVPEAPLGLSSLGQLWSTLEENSQAVAPTILTAALTELCHDLNAGTITAIDVLRSRIDAIATAFQDSITPIPMIFSSSQPHDPTPMTPVEPVDSMSAMEPPASEASWSADEDVTDTHGLELETNEEEDGNSDDSPTVVLSMQLISLEDAGCTDTGRQRDHNEDYFSIQTEIQKRETPRGRRLHAKGLYILCDGMGGHAGGEVASRLAVETLQQYFEIHWGDQLPSEDCIRDAIQQANRVLYDLNQQNASSGSGRMGTTLVLLLLQDTEAVIAHVGDSRLYRLSRRRKLEQITVDHEVGQREIQRGVEPALAYARPDAYQLTQALGPRDENFIHPEVRYLELNEDMVLLLCSDGLSDNDLLETHWQSHLEPLLHAQSNLEQGVQQLIQLANQHNGHDNITAIAIRSQVRPDLDQLHRN